MAEKCIKLDSLVEIRLEENKNSTELDFPLKKMRETYDDIESGFL